MRLDPQGCRARFRAAQHGVLGVNDASAAPLVVPITFAMVEDAQGGEQVVFAVDHKPKSAGPLRRIRLLAADPRASVLVEHYDADWERLWWVRVDGVAEVLAAGSADPDLSRARALDALAARYSQYAARRPEGDLVRIRVQRWTGWAHGPGPA
jgi:PPOX class probable F420-dependent enzyme